MHAYSYFAKYFIIIASPLNFSLRLGVERVIVNVEYYEITSLFCQTLIILALLSGHVIFSFKVLFLVQSNGISFLPERVYSLFTMYQQLWHFKGTVLHSSGCLKL